MKTVTRTITRTILIADEGMILTDGEAYGKEIYLAVDADPSVWREVPESEIPDEEGETL